MSMAQSNRVEASSFQPDYSERLRAEWSMLIGLPSLMLLNAMFPLAGIFLLWLGLMYPVSTPGWSYIAAFFSLAFVPLMFLYNSYRGHRFTRARGPYTYGFDHEGVHVTTPLAQATHRWPAILRVRQHHGNVLLYYSRRCAYFVPVRALPACGSVMEIEELARAGGVPRVGA